MATAARPVRPGQATNFGGSPGGGVLMMPAADLRRTRPKGFVRRESLETSLAKTPDEDPLRILAPGQKKLTTIESQRVLAVVDETSKRLETALILPFLSDSLQRFSVSLGSELVSMMEDYQRLSAEYTRLYEHLEAQGLSPRTENSKTAVNTEQEKELSPIISTRRPGYLEPLGEPDDVPLEERFLQVRHQLRHCIKCILRDLSKDASSASLLRTGAKERSRASTQLLDTVGELQGVIEEKLLTTKSEEVRREEHLRRVVARQKESEEQIKRLEAELQLAQQHKNEEVAHRNGQIKRLRSDIKTVINLTEDAKRRVRSDASKHLSQDEQAHETAKAKIQENMADVSKKLVEDVAANREREQDLRKRNFKRETEVDNWIQKYDYEMGEKQDELEGLETEFDDEKLQLKELEERLGLLTIEYEVAVKEQEEARRKAEEAKKKMNQMGRSAVMIQRFWRAYRERTKEARKSKKGKKGKKKDKGKGKKKKK